MAAGDPGVLQDGRYRCGRAGSPVMVEHHPVRREVTSMRRLESPVLRTADDTVADRKCLNGRRPIRQRILMGGSGVQRTIVRSEEIHPTGAASWNSSSLFW
jgi:hypothetical protein